ncbi:MAG: diguanylate cyclase [Candidatus Limiplasma sp.]|nr:diguanylate cyclase [Candidatus Limiplasma sp.]
MIQLSLTIRMSIACSIACVIGAAFMAVAGHIGLAGIFLLTLFACIGAIPLLIRQRISNEIASLIPILILCFLYTPVSWFTLDGLLGCTPYLTLLFSLVIVLTYYRKLQSWLLIAYGLLVAGLSLHWLLTNRNTAEMTRALYIFFTYLITLALMLVLVESLKRKQLEINQRMIDLSQRDPLTQLLNRRGIQQALDIHEQRYAAAGQDYALVMLDVDRFKRINDDYGHNLGDAVLHSLAECIHQCIRSTDYAGRFGGDEFLLILTHVDQSTVDHVRSRIHAALRDVQGYAFPITTSVGFALRSECDSSDAALELADGRMYENKNRAEVMPLQVSSAQTHTVQP